MVFLTADRELSKAVSLFLYERVKSKVAESNELEGWRVDFADVSTHSIEALELT